MSQFAPDLIVIVAYFALIVSIGLAQRTKSRSVKGFALGDRDIAWWAVLASIIASEISAATFLGAPGEGFEKRNWTYAQLAIGTILARILVSVIFIPIFYKQGVVSIYEFLETRFGRRTRLFASCTFLLTRVLAMGTPTLRFGDYSRIRSRNGHRLCRYCKRRILDLLRRSDRH